MKKNTALVLSGSSNLTAAMASLVINVEEKSPGLFDDVIIFHDNISDKNKKIFNKIRKITFIKYENILTKTVSNNQSKYFGLLCYGVFEIFDLLDKYHNVIYLDCDVIIKKDISGLLDFGPFAMLHQGRSIFQCFKSLPEGLGLAVDTSTYNTGVVVVNDKFNYKGLTSFFYDLAIKQWENNKFADQAIMNYGLLLQEIKVKDLSSEFNRLYGRNEDDAIVHCINFNRKPWNNRVVQRLHNEWLNYYQQWLSLGGEPYTGKVYDNSFTANRINFQSNLDVIVLTKFFVNYFKTELTEIDKFISILIDKINFSKVETNDAYLGYNFSKKSKLRLEIFLYGVEFYIKIFTDNEFFKKRIKNQYSKKLTDFRIHSHTDGPLSFQKGYKLPDFLENPGALNELIIKDTVRLLNATILTENQEKLNG